MTTLAAIQGDGWAVIGCDSRSSDDSGRPMNLATHKIIENNGILIAGSGSSRGSNILQFGWKAPKPTVNENLDKFMTQKFIPQMRQVFIDAGYDMKEDGDAAEHDSSFLVIVRGIAYCLAQIVLGSTRLQLHGPWLRNPSNTFSCSVIFVCSSVRPLLSSCSFVASSVSCPSLNSKVMTLLTAAQAVQAL